MAEGDTYPALGDESFDDLCAVYLADLTESSDAELRVSGLGLMPYSFEIGDRDAVRGCHLIGSRVELLRAAPPHDDG